MRTRITQYTQTLSLSFSLSLSLGDTFPRRVISKATGSDVPTRFCHGQPSEPSKLDNDVTKSHSLISARQSHLSLLGSRSLTPLAQKHLKVKVDLSLSHCVVAQSVLVHHLDLRKQHSGDASASQECRRVVVGSLAHLKSDVGFRFVERELLIEDLIPTNVVIGFGLVCLFAQRDPS